MTIKLPLNLKKNVLLFLELKHFVKKFCKRLNALSLIRNKMKQRKIENKVW